VNNQSRKIIFLNCFKKAMNKLATTTKHQNIGLEVDRLAQEARLFIEFFKLAKYRELANQFPKIPLIIMKIEHLLTDGSGGGGDGRRRSLLIISASVNNANGSGKLVNPTRQLLKDLTGEVEAISSSSSSSKPFLIPRLTLTLLASVKAAVVEYLTQLPTVEDTVIINQPSFTPLVAPMRKDSINQQPPIQQQQQQQQQHESKIFIFCRKFY
jgi:hypothetical protein